MRPAATGSPKVSRPGGSRCRWAARQQLQRLGDQLGCL